MSSSPFNTPLFNALLRAAVVGLILSAGLLVKEIQGHTAVRDALLDAAELFLSTLAVRGVGEGAVDNGNEIQKTADTQK